MVRNDLIPIVKTNAEFDDFVSKIKVQGPEAWFAVRTNTTAPLLLI
jgi:hypothetical protein